MGGSSKQAGERNENTNIDWNMQNPYAATALEKDYWAPDSQEASYVNRLFADIARKYGGRGAEVNQQLVDSGVAPGSGTIGSFNYAQNISQPRAQEESDILNKQYQQRWTGEQNQLAGQRDYTTQLNELGFKKAAGEQGAKFAARESQLDRRQQNRLNDQKTIGDIGSTALYAWNPALGVAKDAATKKTQ